MLVRAGTPHHIDTQYGTISISILISYQPAAGMGLDTGTGNLAMESVTTFLLLSIYLNITSYKIGGRGGDPCSSSSGSCY